MARSKVPVLRKGLTVDDLLEGMLPNWPSNGELVALNEKMLHALCKGLITSANKGERITRKTIIHTLCGLADRIKYAKDHITEKMSRGELGPTILDELAGV